MKPKVPGLSPRSGHPPEQPDSSAELTGALHGPVSNIVHSCPVIEFAKLAMSALRREVASATSWSVAGHPETGRMRTASPEPLPLGMGFIT